MSPNWLIKCFDSVAIINVLGSSVYSQCVWTGSAWLYIPVINIQQVTLFYPA